MIEAYEVNVRIGRDDVRRDGIYGMSVFTTYPPERGDFSGYGDGADFWEKAQQLRAYTHGHDIQGARTREV
jgi:hypothetical protein